MKKGKQSEWQRKFSEAFTGKKMGLKKPEDDYNSPEAKEERRKSREAKRRAGTWKK
jgi:hypothetical protein